jgi:hypothetical protein
MANVDDRRFHMIQTSLRDLRQAGPPALALAGFFFRPCRGSVGKISEKKPEGICRNILSARCCCATANN